MRQLTKEQLAERVRVTCYGRTKTWTREKAIDEFYGIYQPEEIRLARLVWHK